MFSSIYAYIVGTRPNIFIISFAGRDVNSFLTAASRDGARLKGFNLAPSRYA